MGLHPTTHEIMIWAETKSVTNQLSYLGTPKIYIFVSTFWRDFIDEETEAWEVYITVNK